MSSFYAASKAKYGPEWVALRDKHGYDITSRWIDKYEDGAVDDWEQFWVDCVDDVIRSEFLLAVHVDGDSAWKGALVEIGVAIAHGITVIVVGDPPGSWMAHPLVRRASSVKSALEFLK